MTTFLRSISSLAFESSQSSCPPPQQIYTFLLLFILENTPLPSRHRDACACVFIAKCAPLPPSLLLSTCSAAPSFCPGGMRSNWGVNTVHRFIFQEMCGVIFFYAFTRSLLILSLVCSRDRTSHACKQPPRPGVPRYVPFPLHTNTSSLLAASWPAGPQRWSQKEFSVSHAVADCHSLKHMLAYREIGSHLGPGSC